MVLLTAWMAMALHLMLKRSVAMVAKDLVVELPLPIGLALPLMSQAAVMVVVAAVAVVIEAEAQALVAICSCQVSRITPLAQSWSSLGVAICSPLRFVYISNKRLHKLH